MPAQDSEAIGIRARYAARARATGRSAGGLADRPPCLRARARTAPEGPAKGGESESCVCGAKVSVVTVRWSRSPALMASDSASAHVFSEYAMLSIPSH
jgi:hypothetical protein